MLNKIRALSLMALLLSATSTYAADVDADAKTAPVVTPNPVAIISTTAGDITLQLYADKSPVTVANFIDYANSGFYNGTIFHRVIKNFMIQGGGFNKDMVKKNTKAPIINESLNRVANSKYTIAMARTSNPNSATAQFFINTQDNVSLNVTRERAGYAVFGQVTNGKDVVDKIENSETKTVARYSDVPAEQIVITKVVIK
jgi:cyclophilin family peptidyl-prolyl cis-trans isomerase